MMSIYHRKYFGSAYMITAKEDEMLTKKLRDIFIGVTKADYLIRAFIYLSLVYGYFLDRMDEVLGI